MPVMSTVEQAWCRSLPWRAFTRRVVFPWAIGDADLHGDVLELGSGSGAMAAALLDHYPSIRLTATDVDPAMREVAARRLAPYGDRVDVRAADASDLAFPDGSFDAVVSFIMLHHVLDWEQALAEVARVLRPGGMLVGYDIVESAVSRLTTHLDRSPHRMTTVEGLRARLESLPFERVTVTPGVIGLVAAFRAQRDRTAPDHAAASREQAR